MTRSSETMQFSQSRKVLRQYLNYSKRLSSQLKSCSSHFVFSSSKLDQDSQYCMNRITSSISWTRSSKFAIDEPEFSASLFRRFSSAASFPNNILCIFSMHSFMSKAFKTSEFKADSSSRRSRRFAQFWTRSFLPCWIFSFWVVCHFLRERFVFLCSVASLDSLLALSSRFERSEMSADDEWECDVLMNCDISNL